MSSARTDSPSPLACGIDFGASRTAVAITSALRAPHILEWPRYQDQETAPQTIPTALFFPTESSETWCGEPAHQALLTMPSRGVQLFKRRMNDTSWYLEIDERRLDTEDLAALFLTHLRRRLAESTQATPAHTCIAIPAHFDDIARRRILTAAERGGWQQLSLLNEPTAAAVAYAATNTHDSQTAQGSQEIMVFDLGAATLDVSLLTMSPDAIEVHACVGDMGLGGQDWDESLAWDAAHRFSQQFHWSLFDDPIAFEHLRRSCQRAKERLSYQEQLPFSFTYDGCHLALQWHQADLEAMSQGLLQRCEAIARQALKEGDKDPEDIDIILLAGGGSRMPMIRKHLQGAFGRPIDDSLDPASAVALGAAHQAWQRMAHPGVAPLDRATHNPKFLPGQTSHKAPTLIDTTSHPLGILLHRGDAITNRIVIPRHTPLPAHVNLAGFTTSSDQQTHIDLFLTQEESQQPDDNAIFEVWRVSDIPPGPAGQARLRLTFSYSEDGLIELQAQLDPAPDSEGAKGQDLPVSRQPLTPSLAALRLPPPRDIILAIDCSASMQGRSILEAKLAARQFIQALDPSVTRWGLLSFGDPEVQLRVRLDQDPLLLRPHLAALQAKGRSPLHLALHAACEAFSIPRFDAVEYEKIILIITDGHPDQPAAAAEAAAAAKAQDIKIMTIGMGDELNEAYLATQICHSPADLRRAEEPILLGRVMAALAKEMQRPGGDLVKYKD